MNKFKSSKISVVGLGYIGLPTAAMFASIGFNVMGVDINKKVVDTINSGKIHIIEPGLEELVKSAVSDGNLLACLEPEVSDIFLISVPTPLESTYDDVPKPDVSYIKNAITSIAGVLKKGDLVILESTSPVGTTEQISKWMSIERPDLTFPHYSGESADISVAHCPERVLPGKVINELINNDRIIGGLSSRCSRRASDLFKSFVKGECIITNARTAEMAKLTENTCRDVQIAFANELSVICDKIEIDVWELISIANRHPRINILQPGPGVGGHCIAVDPWFIVSQVPNDSQLIKTAREVNDKKPTWVVNKIKLAAENYVNEHPEKNLHDVTIVIYGVTFKANIDDIRESPSLEIAERISDEHPGPLLIVEPNIKELPKNIAHKAKLVSMKTAEDLGDVEVLLVDHHEFMQQKFTRRIASKTFVDTRGIVQ